MLKEVKTWDTVLKKRVQWSCNTKLCHQIHKIIHLKVNLPLCLVPSRVQSLGKLCSLYMAEYTALQKTAFVRNKNTHETAQCVSAGRQWVSLSPSLFLSLPWSMLQWSWKEVIRQNWLLAQHFPGSTYLYHWGTIPNHLLPFSHHKESRSQRSICSFTRGWGERETEGDRERERETEREKERVTRLQPPLFSHSHTHCKQV